MKSILYSVCIGSLAVALTAGGAQAAKDKRPERAKPQQRTAKVQAARPANTGRTMAAHLMFRPHSSAAVECEAAYQFCSQSRSPAGVGDASYSSRTKPREERKDA